MIWMWYLLYDIYIRDDFDHKKYSVKYLGINSTIYSQIVQKNLHIFGGGRGGGVCKYGKMLTTGIFDLLDILAYFVFFLQLFDEFGIIFQNKMLEKNDIFSQSAGYLFVLTT